MQTLTGPLQGYVIALQDGKLKILFTSANYRVYWVIFIIAAIAVYALVARWLFKSSIDQGLKVGFSAVTASVTGLFAVVVTFYVVFMFSPAKVEAWLTEITLLIIWFIYFIFAYATAPESR